MTSDEIEMTNMQKTINKLLIRIEQLETIHPPGSAKKVFDAFWNANKNTVKGRKELASLAFDAGHQMRHRKPK